VRASAAAAGSVSTLPPRWRPRRRRRGGSGARTRARPDEKRARTARSGCSARGSSGRRTGAQLEVAHAALQLRGLGVVEVAVHDLGRGSGRQGRAASGSGARGAICVRAGRSGVLVTVCWRRGGRARGRRPRPPPVRRVLWRLPVAPEPRARPARPRARSWRQPSPSPRGSAAGSGACAPPAMRRARVWGFALGGGARGAGGGRGRGLRQPPTDPPRTSRRAAMAL
jgi:hypothetical protein